MCHTAIHRIRRDARGRLVQSPFPDGDGQLDSNSRLRIVRHESRGSTPSCASTNLTWPSEPVRATSRAATDTQRLSPAPDLTFGSPPCVPSRLGVSKRPRKWGSAPKPLATASYGDCAVSEAACCTGWPAERRGHPMPLMEWRTDVSRLERPGRARSASSPTPSGRARTDRGPGDPSNG